ncbi:hypothetical protein Taro_055582, partial [Colocasia esculenta]|nr:hypothetical protein [Colocasia esculenta]
MLAGLLVAVAEVAISVVPVLEAVLVTDSDPEGDLMWWQCRPPPCLLHFGVVSPPPHLPDQARLGLAPFCDQISWGVAPYLRFPPGSTAGITPKKYGDSTTGGKAPNLGGRGAIPLPSSFRRTTAAAAAGAGLQRRRGGGVAQGGQRQRQGDPWAAEQQHRHGDGGATRAAGDLGDGGGWPRLRRRSGGSGSGIAAAGRSGKTIRGPEQQQRRLRLVSGGWPSPGSDPPFQWRRGYRAFSPTLLFLQPSSPYPRPIAFSLRTCPNPPRGSPSNHRSSSSGSSSVAGLLSAHVSTSRSIAFSSFARTRLNPRQATTHRNRRTCSLVVDRLSARAQAGPNPREAAAPPAVPLSRQLAERPRQVASWWPVANCLPSGACLLPSRAHLLPSGTCRPSFLSSRYRLLLRAHALTMHP